VGLADLKADLKYAGGTNEQCGGCWGWITHLFPLHILNQLSNWPGPQIQ